MKSESKQQIIEYYEDFLKSLYSCLQTLIRVIEKENKFLSGELTGNFSKLLELKEDSLRNLEIFDQSKTELTWKDGKSNNSKLLLEKVGKAHTYLQDVIQANSILLKSSIGVSGKILELYKAKQLEHAVGQLGYNKDGEMVALKKLEKIMPSISLNNKI